MSEHVNISDPEIHEPKGISSAVANSIYVSDGNGSGSWEKEKYHLSCTMQDVSSANTILIPVPKQSNLVKVNAVLEGALTGSNAVITIKDSSDTSLGTFDVVSSGSAKGDSYFINISINNTIAENSYFQVESDGGPTTVGKLFFTFTMEL